MSRDSVDWPALERMFLCQDYGTGFWRYVSADFAERNSRNDPPRDCGPRWSARGPVSPDGVVSGEMEAR